MGFSRQEYWSGVPLPSPRQCLEECRLLLVNENYVSSPIPPPNILCEGCSFVTQGVSIWGISGALLQVLSSSALFHFGCAGFSLRPTDFSGGVWAQLPRGMWDLSFPTGDRTCISCIGRQILNLGATREVPQIQLLFQAQKRRLVLHGLQFDWSRHCLTGSQFTHVVCVSTPGFLSPCRIHWTFTCVLPRNLGKAYASWGNSWMTRGLKQAHHLFFLSPVLALRYLHEGFQRVPWSGNYCIFDCRFDNTSLVYYVLCLTPLSLTPYPEITPSYVWSDFIFDFLSGAI